MFLADGEVEAERLTWVGLEARARSIAAALAAQVPPGERALLLHPPGLEFIAAFFGCLFAGVVAVPATPPRPRKDQPRLRSIVRDAEPRLALTTAELLPGLERAAAADPALAGLRWLATDRLPAVGWEGPAPDPGALAFLQYTSGSTAAPKGVMVTHANLIHNEGLIGDAFAMDEESVVVGWLPLYHDMGLIGNVLQPLWCGGRCVLMSPVAFLQRPRRWLEAVTRYRATTSGGPNFAYDLCVRKVGPEEREGLDLSSWRVAFNGAEPVRAGTLERFAAAFAESGFRREAFFPCYGLAEATLFVAGGRVGEAPRVEGFAAAALEESRVLPAAGEAARRLVSCGAPWGGQRVAIVDPETGTELPAGRIGEIRVSGPSVAAGYWKLPEASAATFGATLADDPERWLRTGDLGFLDGGELFVTGRLKDLIILRGRNHYPQDLELTAERSHPALRPGCGASFSVEVGGEERLVVVQELDRRTKESETAAILEAIRQAVAAEHEVGVHEVVLVRVGGVPRTSSGKIQRRTCRAAYLAGELPVVVRSLLAPVSQDEELAPEPEDADLLAVLRAEIARALSVPRGEIPPGQPLTALGLDSLTAVELQQAVAARTGRQIALSDLLQGITLERLAEACAEGPETEPGAGFEAAAADPAEPAPLSHGQRALWFLQHRDPGSAALHLAAAFHVAGLDVDAFRRALEALQARHAALRTVFGEAAGEPFQRVEPSPPPPLPRAGEGSKAKTSVAEGWWAFHPSPARGSEGLRSEAFRPFDLSAPLLRARVWTEEPGRHLVLLVVHHLVADFTSVAILLRELDLLYRQETGSVERVALPPPAGTPAEFAGWQARQLAGPAGERGWSYWRERLAGELPVLALSTDQPRPAWLSDRGWSLALRLAPETADRLRRLGRAEGATLFATLLAAYQVLLHRHSGQDGLLVGTPAAGRTHPRLAGQVGYLVQPVALRSDLSGDPAVGELLRRTRETVASALEHQDFPLPLLAERLQPERDPGRSPLFQTLFVLHRDPPGGAGLAEIALGAGGVGLELGGLTWESVALGEHRAQFELSLAAADASEGLSVVLQASRDLFDEATVERLLGRFAVLLDGFGAGAGRPVADLPLLPPAEEEQIRAWSTGPDLPEEDGCLHELFAAQAARTPRAEALVAGDERLTYEQLEARARQLAHHLRALGVGPEVTVGVCLERSADLVVSLLGVLEAGGAYVPLDPAYPGERLAGLLEDAQAGVLITRERWLPRRPERTVLLGSGALPEAPSESAPRAALPSNLAYLIYTSGSTGRPKGVAIAHRNAVALVRWARQVFSEAELAGVLAATSVGFDLSIFELFVPLSWGGRVILADNALALPSLAAASEVTLVNTVPSAITELAEMGALPAGGVTVNLAGEALSEALVRRLHGLPAVRRLLNLYGPSETTTYSTFAEISAGLPGTPPIGLPVAGERVHLLDAGMRPVPVGAPGEVWIGGAGVARGYYRRPDLTAERFVPDPFAEAAGGRLYRTGDLARRRPSGALEYLGRGDHQVKIRGVRIELGEIEAALAACPGVREAVAGTRESAGGERRLVAWVTGAGSASLTGEELREALRARLPEVMVPAAFVVLDEMPLTPHGKIDRKALPAPAAAAPAGGFVPPRGPLEELLAGIWAEMLGVAAVSRTDSFFQLGGHSLMAARLLARLRDSLDVELPLRALFEAPGLAALARRIEQARGLGAAAVLPPVVPVERHGELPLSFAQERLWFLDQLEPGSAAYNIPGAVRLAGALDIPALGRALDEIVRRHEVLRTRFPEAAEAMGRAVQIVEPPRPLPLPMVDLRGLPEAEREAEARRLAAEDALRPFDLARGPLLRALLLWLDGQTWICRLDLHHIVADGWSLGLLETELAALHAALREGRPSPLAGLEIQYADYAVWQRRHLDGDRLAGELAWWRRQLAGAPEALQLPTDGTAPRRPDGRQPVALSAPLRDRLERLGRQAGATLYMTLLAAFAALLSRWADQEELVVGSPVAGRPRRELEGLIGLFVNSLALRVDLADGPSFAGLLGRVRETALAAFAHQEVPFEKLVEQLAPERRLGRSPLFQVMLALQTVPSPAAAAGLTLRREPAPPGVAKLDLSLELWPGESPGDGGIAGWIDYRGALFDGATIRRLAACLERLLAAAAADPGQPVAALPLLGEEERRQILGWSRSPGSWTAPGTVHGLFSEQARRTPDAVAVAGVDASLTYGALHQAADRLAAALGDLGTDRLVGLMADPGPDLAAGLLGILAAGGAFVPLHPGQPEERLRYATRDGRLGLLVTESRHLALARRVAEAAGGPCRIVCLDDLPAAAPVAAIPPPEAIAWVIYTSGSTGRPKGVAVSHASAVAMLRWSRAFFGLGLHTRVLQSLSYAFDFGVWEILTTLLSGGVLHTLAPDEQGDAAAWARRARAEAVDTIHATPSFFRAVQETGIRLEAVRILHLGGEALTRAAVERFATAVGEECVVYNGYGPTEVTVNSLIFDAGRSGRWRGGSGGERVPIGRPSAENAAYVVSRQGELQPAGFPGELWVGGPGVARGYLGRPDLTAARFVPDPFGDEAGGRLYRTGDLVRWLSEGDVEFLGRLDDQVKIRGFRVEPGEIEAVLRAHPNLREAVVAAREVDGRGLELVAWVVPEGDGPAPEALRGFLRASLPEAMVPAFFVPLADLPLTATGKVDRKALPDPLPEAGGGGAPGEGAPRTELEALLAEVWGEVLGRERVGLSQSFFDLGGHSLLAARVTSRLRSRLGIEVPVALLFRAPTIAGLAREVEALLRPGTAPAPPITPVPREGPLPLSWSQERLWFLEKLAPGGAAYNMTSAVRLAGELDGAALAAALDEIVRRHESLRTVFPGAGGLPVQQIEPPRGAGLARIDLTALPAAEREAELGRLVGQAARSSFDLEHGPLARFALVALGAREHALILELHHSVADGWSIGILQRELSALYEAARAGTSVRLPALPVQPADHGVWQRSWLHGEELERRLAFWRRELAGAPTVLVLPADRPRPPVFTFRGTRYALGLPADVTAGLRGLARGSGATLFMALLAGFQALLARLSGQPEVLVGTPVAGRNRAEIEEVIGFFVNTLVIRGDLWGGPSFRDLLVRVRERWLAADAHQEVPFEKLVEELAPERDPARSPLVQVLLALQNAPLRLELPGLAVSPLEADSGTAKLDLGLVFREQGEELAGWIEYSTDLFDEATIARLAGDLRALLEGALAAPGMRFSETPLLPQDLSRTARPRRTRVAPRTPTEEQVAAVWADLLEVESVGVFDSFFDLGGHSLLANRVVVRLREVAGVAVPLGRFFELPTVAGLAAEIEARRGLGATAMDEPVLSVAQEGDRPLSFAQERLWFLEKLAPGGSAYNMTSAARLTGELDGAALEGALDEIVRRHESLRTVFPGAGGLPVQRVEPPRGAGLLRIDLTALPAVEREAELGSLVERAAHRSFDLERGPLARFALVALAAREHALVLELHHSVADGWSLGVLQRDLSVLYGAARAGLPARLPALPVQPADHAVWQRSRLHGEALESRLAFWRRELAGAPTVLELPADRPRPPVFTFRGAQYAFRLPASLIAGLRGLARGSGATLFMALLAGFQALLARRTGQPELLVGTPVAGRNRAEIEEVIGLFVNTLVIRGDLRGGPSFRDLVERVRERWLAAAAHQEVPFDRLVEELAPERDPARSPLVQAMLALQNMPLRLELPGLAVSRMEVDPGTAKLDLSLFLWEQGEELAGWVEYSTDLFDEVTIAQLAGDLRTLLESALARPGASLAEMSLLPQDLHDTARPGGLAAAIPERGRAAVRPARTAPRTPTEEVVAGIWADLLGVEGVGAFDSFFDLGGHSLLANRVAVRLQEAFGVGVPLARFFQEPTVAGLAATVEALRAVERKGADEPIRPVSRARDLPLSFSQERLWILDRFEPGSANFNIPASVRLRGALDAGALERALREIAARHESLRTTFAAAGERAVQRIAPAAAVSLPVVDLHALPDGERARVVDRWSRDVTTTSFDLARGPLLRLLLLRTEEREHVLLLAVHHIVSDGWSIGVLIRELSTLYAALAAGSAPELPDLPVQYADYAVWQRERLSGERREELVRFWRERLAGAPPALELPTDRPRPAIRTFRGDRRPLSIPGPLAGELRRLARRQGVSLFMLLLAAFEVVLARLSGQEDVVVGTPVAGRGRPELEGLFGMFLNTLVLRTGLAGDPPFSELLRRVRATALEAFDHQELPFEKLLDELRPERDLSRTPLFQVFFNMLNFPVERVELPGLTLEPLDPPEHPAKFDLTVYVEEAGAEIRFELVYNADLFTDPRMAELLRQYAAVLEQVAEAPERPIGELSLVTEAARLVLPDPRVELDPSWQGAVHEIFAEWARREPGRLAVTDKDESWTYGELAASAGRLAGRLAAGGIGRGDVVAIYGHRSARLVWAVLGVLAAGAAFTVLDPAHPPARQAECLRIASPRGWIALTAAGPLSPELEAHVAAIPCRLTLPLPSEGDPFAEGSAAAPAVPVGPDDLAYVAFTSGSTGVPKGILGRHGPLSHFIPWQRREFDLRESDRYSLLSGLAHDPLQRDMFTPLQTGGAICVPDPADIAVPGRLAEWMCRERVTVAHLTPAMGQILTELPPGSSAVRLEALRWAFFVGDVLTRRDVARLRELAPGVTCVNFYGSTETQRAVGYHVEPAGTRRTSAPARDNLPLGRGMRDVQLLVLSHRGELAGIGEIGEIHVRSPHLARGYLGDPAGTAARFIADSGPGPFGQGRMYRTGDLGRYLPDGEVEFAGRVDFQLKIRGFRIEPGEIESLLARHPAVRESVVVGRDGARGEKRLVAYVVPQSEASAPPVSELRLWLKERLPEAMIPAAFVVLPRLPLNPNGKVDRRALPEPREEHRDHPEGGFEGPRNETERALAAVLLDVLQVEKIGIHDNFFELGGNSLLLVRAHARLRELLGGELQVVDLFSNPTVASLAEYLGRSRKEPAAVRQSDERADKIGAGQGRLRALRQRQQGAR